MWQNYVTNELVLKLRMAAIMCTKTLTEICIITADNAYDFKRLLLQSRQI